MTIYMTHVGAQQESLGMIHKLDKPAQAREIWKALKRDPILLPTITQLEFNGRVYHVAAFGVETNDNGTDKALSHVQHSKNVIAQVLRDDQDGRPIYGEIVLVFSTVMDDITKTIYNVNTNDGERAHASLTTNLFVVKVTNSKGQVETLAANGHPVTYSKNKATKVAEAMARDDAKRGITNHYAVAKA